MADLKRIQERLDIIPSLIEEVKALRPVSSPTHPTGPSFPLSVVLDIKEKINTWYEVTSTIVAQEIGEADPYLFKFCEQWRAPIRGLSFQEQYIQRLLSAGANLRTLVAVAAERGGDSPKKESLKTPKVFISHKTEDKAYADALVSLINYIIGRDGDKVFCSSIPGYGVRPAQDIIDKVKEQFNEHDLFVVLIHSPRYYKSPVCLNEMGAAWALNTPFCSFLTKDCRIDQLTGVIGKEEICINPNDEEEMLCYHLNSFKDDLVAFFGATPIYETKWEHERGLFIKAIEEIKDAEIPEDKKGLFDAVYLPSIDSIFELLQVDHFSDWAYDCAIDGNSILRKSIYDNMGLAIKYIKSRPKHKEYASWDSLLMNLGQLLFDFRYVFSCHSESFGEDAYYVTRFYKKGPHGESFNPNYNVDLKAYEEHTKLLSDLIFELARLCNLILEKIREIHPDYKQELGILHIDDRISEPDLIYREEEVSDSPYPGMTAFIKERLTREKHFGQSGTINVDGYEQDREA